MISLARTGTGDSSATELFDVYVICKMNKLKIQFLLRVS